MKHPAMIIEKLPREQQGGAQNEKNLADFWKSGILPGIFSKSPVVEILHRDGPEGGSRNLTLCFKQNLN